MADYTQLIEENLDNCLESTDLGLGEKYTGKVRDRYELADRFVMVATDRHTSFDRFLALIPFKGQVLNQTSAWWFEQTKDLIPNHVLAVPDPNVTVAKKCDPFKVEFVMRSYLTGSTSTSIWTHYQAGERTFGGVTLPDDLAKNTPLPQTIITPSTKSDENDETIAAEEVASRGLMSQDDWDTASGLAFKLFEFAQQKAREHGLILVDTKFEFGKDADGTIRVIDEILTPDSSRYWMADSFEARLSKGEEPEYFDKEFLRLWFKENSDPYKDAELPPAPPELVAELSRRYIQIYEMITGQQFQFPDAAVPITERIAANLAK